MVTAWPVPYRYPDSSDKTGRSVVILHWAQSPCWTKSQLSLRNSGYSGFDWRADSWACKQCLFTSHLLSPEPADLVLTKGKYLLIIPGPGFPQIIFNISVHMWTVEKVEKIIKCVSSSILTPLCPLHYAILHLQMRVNH